MVEGLFPLPEPCIQFKYPREKDEMSMYLVMAYEECGVVGFLNSFDYLHDAIEYAEEHCSLGICLDWIDGKAKVIGILLLEWNHPNPRHATLHVYTWDNKIKWPEVFKDMVLPAIFECSLDKLVMIMPKRMKAIKILCKRIGFTFSDVMPVQYSDYKHTHTYGELTYGCQETGATT